MRRVQTPLAIALLFEGLFVLAFAWAVLVGGPIDFLYRSAAGLSTFRNVAQDAAILAGVVLFIAALIVAVNAAFLPTSRGGRVLHILPIYALGITFVICVAALFSLATTGTMLSIGMAQLTMSTVGIIVGIALSTIAVAIAAARLHLSNQTIKSATAVASIVIVPTVIAAVALVAAVVIVSTTTPSFSFGGPGGGAPGGGGGQGGAGGRNSTGGSATQSAAGGSAGQNGPRGAGAGTQAAPGGNAGQNAPGAVTEEVPSGSAAQNGPGPSGTQAATGGNAAQNGAGGGRPAGGQGGPGGGGPGGGGPGGGFTSFVGTYRTTGIVAAVFALIALIGAFSAVRAMRSFPAEQAAASAPRVSYGREATSVLASVVGLSVVIFVVIQFVPVNRDNPPVQTTPNWDSPQTESLFMNACANCHSNLTKWPWYSYVAPSSWLQDIHVHDARDVFNISELNKLPAFEKNQMANNVRMHLTDKSMPPADYLLLHPEARLTDAQRQQLIDGMRATLAKS